MDGDYVDPTRIFFFPPPVEHEAYRTAGGTRPPMTTTPAPPRKTYALAESEAGDGEGRPPAEDGTPFFVSKPFGVVLPVYSACSGVDGFTKVKAKEAHDGRPGIMVLPEDWVAKIDPGSVRYFELDPDYGVLSHALARLKEKPDVEVAFEIWSTNHPSTKRQRKLSHILAETGAVQKAHETRVYSRFPDTMFVLTESTSTRSLAELISEWEALPRSDPGPVVPLETALPIMVDLLRSAHRMEEQGVVYADFSEDRLFLLNEDSHAIVTDLRAMCMLDSDDERVSCATMDDQGLLYGSAYRHAPEMVNGKPTGFSNHAWQLGLVFSRLILGGGNVVTRPFTKNATDDDSGEGRRRIREIIEDSFTIRSHAAFEGSYGSCSDVLSIISGMLVADPEHRMTTHTALELMKLAAQARGLPWRAARLPMPLPAEWRDSAL